MDSTSAPTSNKPYRASIVWRNVAIMSILHAFALYGITIFHRLRFYSIVFACLYHFVSGLGVTAGVHRLWSHRCYRAARPLRVFLMLANSIAMQNSIYVWVRDHRVHHKHTETSADPHDAKRGFFFAHVGWLLVRKHPDVIRYGKQIDLSDIENDPVVMFQHRHYTEISLFMSFLLPTVLPVLLWNESAWNAYFCVGVVRYLFTLHSTWLVNSAAHMWGMRPYDKTIQPRENYFVSWFSFGEGFHNYHHVFPFDYRTSEFGSGILNLTTGFIETCVRLGLASHCRRPTDETIKRRIERTGNVSLAN